ncbi:MAG TPA: signal peptide peptidase SppA [Stellaceae bacterium]|nr:signal peptide peptidase SppA [Stellaceae bacterium]
MRFIVRFFALIGFLVFAGFAAGVGLALWGHFRGGGTVSDGTVLSLDIGGGFPDGPPSNALSKLLQPGRPPLKDVLDAIEKAGDDPRVKGLIAHTGGDPIGLAQAQELRDAIIAFRAKGKRAVIDADSFGDFSSGTSSYYLASAFDEIWLQPLGLVGLVGLRAEGTYFRGTLDLLGVVARFDHREQYKSATDPLTEKTMTAADREQQTALLTSDMNQIVHDIATARKLDDATVRALVDRGPLLAQEALAAHLIDHIGYSDEVMTEMGVGPGGSKKPLSLASYLAAVGRPHKSGPTIALIYASGLITEGANNPNPLVGEGTVGSQTLIDAFRSAERDKDVKAILFRIDSPGGSAVASESIWRETMRAKEAGKKIVVSMGDVAASGGYYIAASADKIVAEPATITGSIGVLAGKFLFAGLLNKIGGGWSAVQVGDNAGIDSSFEDFTPAQTSRFEAMLDNVYDGFKDRVAKGRRLDAASVEAVAKGRVWSGADAKDKGLVDALGGMSTALALAKAEAGIPADSDVTVKIYPAPQGPLRALLSRAMGRDVVDAPAAEEAAPALVETLEAALQRLAMPPGALLMAPVDVH